MKKCPFCQATYSDPEQKYCLEDGALREDTSAATPDSQATLVSRPGSAPVFPLPTEASPGGSSPGGSNPGGSSPGGSRPGGWRVPPPEPRFVPEPKKSKVGWVVGGFALLFVGLLVAGIASLVVYEVFFAPHDSDSNSNNQNLIAISSNRPSNLNRNFSSASPSPTSTPVVNRNTDPGNNLNSNSFVPDPDSPGDYGTVLTDLTRMENDWMKANVSANKTELNRILSPEYRGVLSDGSIKTKKMYIDGITPDYNVKSWSISGIHLTLNGTSATVVGTVNWVTDDNTTHFSFRDEYVWRNGRWQAVGSVNLPSTKD